MRATDAGFERVIYLGVGVAPALQFRYPGDAGVAQFVELTESNRLRGARLGARGNHPGALPVVAERAFERAAIRVAFIDYAERAGHYAIAAAITNVGLHEYGANIRPDDCAGRTRFQASCIPAVLANVGQENPPEWILHIHLLWARSGGLFEEHHVAPAGRSEHLRVVVGEACPDHSVVWNFVPLLARNFAGFTADADGGVGEESGFRHAILPSAMDWYSLN